MKRIVALGFLVGCIFSGVFAKQKHDIILAPLIGYTNIVTLKHDREFFPKTEYFNSHNGYVEFMAGLILDNGFTYFEDTGFAVGTAYFKTSHTNKQISTPSMFFQSRSLIGYTFRPTKDIHINLLAGAGVIIGYPQILQLGIPVNVGFSYFFAKKVGLNITASDMVGVGFPSGLTNAFIIKIGPVFRL